MTCRSYRILLCVLSALLCGASSGTLWAQGKKPAQNPLERFFRGLNNGIREGAEDLKNRKTARDQFDLRPVQKPEDNRKLQQATDLVQAKKWHDAIEVLQYLIELPTDVFSLSETLEFKSIQSEADRLLDSLPAEGLRNYVNRYGVTADQLLQKGLALQDADLLLNVSTHYFHTPAGQAALKKLARLWEDQGEFGRAAESYLRLLSKVPEGEKPGMTRLAIRNLTRAGRTGEALRLTEGLPDNQQLRLEIEALQAGSAADTHTAGPFLQLPDNRIAVTDPTPALLPRWSENLIERFNIVKQAERIATQLRESGRALLPTIQPLIVQDTVAFRSLRSLQVRDLHTGKQLWERRMQESPEELLTTSPDASSFGLGVFTLPDEGVVEHLPLTSLLYRDELYGSLSSDGVRLYAIESPGKASLTNPMQLWRMESEHSSASVPWETNELTAFDLRTGQIRWQVGGPEFEKEFSGPLSGIRFFAAPNIDGSELFIIGEREGEVSLYCLSASTGEALWSQPLAAPGRPIKEDMVRRHWTARPVIAEGVILCPTTCGWLVAIDRATHRLKWTSRYAPRMEDVRQYRGGFSVQPLQELNRRWHDITTLVTQGKVIIAPPEIPDEFGTSAPMIYCFDLQTGQQLWGQPKTDRNGGSQLYLAGIWNDQLVVVGTSRVLYRDVQTGEVKKVIELRQRPSGRGVIINDSLLLPVAGSTLLKINLSTATIASTLLPVVDGELGNLDYANGELVALSYQSATTFPVVGQASEIPTEPDQLARTRIREIRLLLSNQEFTEVQKIITQTLPNSAISPLVRQELLDLQRTALVQQLRTEPADTKSIIEQLQSIAQTPQHLRECQKIRAEHFLQEKNFSQSLAALLEIFEQFPPDERVTDGTRDVRIDGWVGGRLRHLMEDFPEDEQQAEFQQAVAARLAQLGNDLKAKDRWARALAFDTLGLKLELELAEDNLRNGNVAAGLMRLSRIIDSGNTSLRPQALAKMAQELAQRGWHQDAAAYWEQLQQISPAVDIAGQGSQELASAGLAAARDQIQKAHATENLWAGPWKVQRTGLTGHERNLEPVRIMGDGLKALEDLRLEQLQDVERVRVSSCRTGDVLASFPLRTVSGLEHDSGAAARLLQSMFFVVHRGTLHAIQWPDEKVAWSWSPDLQQFSLARMSLSHPQLNYELQPLAQFIAVRQFLPARDHAGYLVAASPRMLLMHCNDWIALDPISGEELWREHQAPERGRALEIGSDWVMTPGQGGRTIRSAVDGEVQKKMELADLASRTLSVVGQDLIVLNRTLRNEDSTPVVQLQKVTLSGQVVWDATVPNDVTMSLVDRNSFVWLTPDRELVLFDLVGGEQTQLGKLPRPSEDLKSPVSVIADRDRIYVFADSGDTQPLYLYLPSFRFAGRVIAFDRQGHSLWTYETPMVAARETAVDPAPEPDVEESGGLKRRWPLNVIVQDFDANPLIVLAGDINERKLALTFHKLRIIGLDKATGEAVVDWEKYSENGGFSFLHVDSEQGLVDLRTHNERFQLTPHATLPMAPEVPR